MSLRSQEMSERIKDAIRHYHKQLDVAETGTVMTVGDGIALVHGLRNAMSSELLLFPNDVYGMVMNLEEEQVGVVLLGDDSKIKEGDVVRRTGKIVEVPVGDMMLGRVIDALGNAIDGGRPVGRFKHDAALLTVCHHQIHPGFVVRAQEEEFRAGRDCLHRFLGQERHIQRDRGGDGEILPAQLIVFRQGG